MGENNEDKEEDEYKKSSRRTDGMHQTLRIADLQ
jgi:hypothetical protein